MFYFVLQMVLLREDDRFGRDLPVGGQFDLPLLFSRFVGKHHRVCQALGPGENNVGIDLGIAEGAFPCAGVCFTLPLVVFEEGETCVSSPVSKREYVTDVEGSLFRNRSGRGSRRLIARQPVIGRR